MKRFLTVSFIISMILAVCLSAFLRGDINGDSELDNKDVVFLFRYVSGGEKVDDETSYDFNNDEAVDNKDVVSLFRLISIKTHTETSWYTDDMSASEFFIGTKEELEYFAKLVNDEGVDFSGKTVYLTRSIDLSSEEWEPIGNENRAFAGTFDGDKFTISDFKVTEKTSYAGLFGNVSGALRNLNVTGAEISVNKKGENIAAVCGYLTGVMSNVSVSGSVDAAKCEKVGGLFGFRNGGGSYDLNNLKNEAIVTGGNYTGGIGGYIYNTLGDTGTYTMNFNVIENSGSITGQDYTGGAFGYIYGHNSGNYWGTGTIIVYMSELKNTGAVSGNDYVGGLIGYGYTQSSESYIDASASEAVVTGNAYVGGLCGKLENISIKDCDNTKTTVTANGSVIVDGVYYAYVGGYAGYSYKISGCENNSDIIYTGKGRYVGGIAGFSCGAIEDCTNNAAVSGADYVGGIFGYDQAAGNVDYKNLKNTGNVSGKMYVGGIAGYVINVVGDTGTYTMNFNTIENNGSITGQDYTGGTFGYIYGHNNGNYWGTGAIVVNMTEIKNTGAVSGNDYVGGLIGYGYSNSADSYLDNSSSGVAVTGNAYVGGLCGKVDNISIKDCDNTGTTITAAGDTMVDGVFYAYVGGYAGQSYKVSGCENNSDIIYTGKGRYVGGVAGFACGVIEDCTNNAEVSGADYVGGIFGYDQQAGNITYKKLKNTGNINGKTYVGGIAGYIVDTLGDTGTYGMNFNVIENSGNVTGQDYTGGVFGYIYGHNNGNYWGTGAIVVNMTEIKNTGAVSGNDCVGGLIGYGHSNSADSYLDYSSSGVAVTGNTYVGGLCGKLESISIKECDNTGTTITATGDTMVDGVFYAYIGGYAGYSYRVIGCENNTDIIYTGNGRYVGGISGYTHGIIEDCTNNAEVSGADYVGGIFGYDQQAGNITYKKLKNTGNINGKTYVGGIAGYIVDTLGDTGTYGMNFNVIENSGNITGQDYTGGVFGYVYGHNSGNYWGNGAIVINMTEIKNTGAVIGNDYVGGLVGYGHSNSSDSIIEYYTQTGTVTATGENTGDIGGKLDNITIK